LKGRLERGRELLRHRLLRRGLGPAGLIVATAWPASSMSAPLSPACVAATVAAAGRLSIGKAVSGLVSPFVASLLKGSLKSMVLTRTSACLAATGLVLTMTFALSAVAWQSPGPSPDPRTPIEDARNVEGPAAAPKVEKEADGVVSTDGILALRLEANPVVAAPGQAIELTATLRNASKDPVHVLRPFGVPSLVPALIDIRGPRGKLAYRGDPPVFRVGGDAFVRRRPGESVQDRLKLDVREFVGLEMPGSYTLHFTYGYQGQWDRQAEQAGLSQVWRGKIPGKELPIEIRRPAPPAAIEPAVQAFVDYVQRNGIELTSAGDPNVWQVVEPRLAEGPAVVRILWFPPHTPEEHVSAVLGQLDMGQVYKMDLKLAVTALRIRTFDQKEADPMTRDARHVQGRIFHLLNAYTPPPLEPATRAGS
jgi:hypothetical protein